MATSGAQDPAELAHWLKGEHIVRRVVPLKDLQATLKGGLRFFGLGLTELNKGDYADRGFAIDALVACIAQGVALAGSFRA